MSRGSLSRVKSSLFARISFTVATIFFVMSFVGSTPCVGQEAVISGSRKVIEKVQPTYPMLARQNSLSGIVKLRVTVSPDGHPKDVSVVGGSPVFVDSATASVKKWKWSAADHETTEFLELRFNPS
jgi:TonB family protein